ncbi:hypothetical protein Pd630_LPD16065 (plasmid) [Rhodococcus opacus PD630]|nr:hypothetical protein Pd630_LPD16065 [Rhodococcus opacus PD630]
MWVVSEVAWVDGEVAVLRRFGQGDDGGAAAQVHRLRTDHDQRVTVVVEGVQGVEECAACLDEEVIAARLIHVPASIL